MTPRKLIPEGGGRDPSEATDIRFSVITVTRNAARHIKFCLESVARQSYGAIEHIVVDGASTDGTQKIVRRYNESVRHFVSESDQGIYDAMNKGIALASGDYVLFLGADDRLVDDQVIAEAAAFLSAEGRPDLIYGNLEVRHVDGHVSVFRPAPPAEALDLMICGCLPHQSTFAKRTLFFDRVGMFDTRYRVQSDYDWFLRVLGTEGLRILYFDRVAGSFRMGGASSQLQRGQEETYAIQNAFPLYREPEWMEKRLRAFQKELLNYRIQASRRESILSRIPRAGRILAAMRRVVGAGTR